MNWTPYFGFEGMMPNCRLGLRAPVVVILQVSFQEKKEYMLYLAAASKIVTSYETSTATLRPFC